MREQHFSYGGLCLGVTLEKESTIFRLWSSSATNVTLNIYQQWDEVRRESYKLIRHENHLWELKLPENLEGLYYTYSVERYGTHHEIVDPYAVAASPNSKKGQIVELSKSNPKDWENSIRPTNTLMDTVIYETHIRDLTVKWHEDLKLRGTFNGVTDALLERIKDLGVTHIQWMPIFDFASVDDHVKEYNWGYDPLLFNVVEGSYASDVIDPLVRIKELKEMILRCHKAGLRVIMDVVYNHTYHSRNSNLNRVGHGYFYRMDGHNFSNGSGCGNELATENEMVRKFIIDSLLYWQKEYKIDGFRFDLMGLYDLKTVNAIEKELRSSDPEVLLYGEPWTGAATLLPYEKQFRKGVMKNGGVGAFNDVFRNAVKGDNDSGERGYIGGVIDPNELLNCLLGSPLKNGLSTGFNHFPWESINYLTSHDNLNLFDKISKSFPDASAQTKKKITGLCFSILLTSVGLPFIQGGAEMMVSKKGFHNTYNLGDDINAYDWDLSEVHEDLQDYIRQLIRFRRETFLYQLTDFKEISEVCHLSINEQGVILMEVVNPLNNERLLILHNGSEHIQNYEIREGHYKILSSEEWITKERVNHVSQNTVRLPAYQTVIIKAK